MLVFNPDGFKIIIRIQIDHRCRGTMARKRFAVIFHINDRQIQDPAENTRQPGGFLPDQVVDRRRDDDLVDILGVTGEYATGLGLGNLPSFETPGDVTNPMTFLFFNLWPLIVLQIL
jgi:hypothetical protein